jgi:hypothetical protein
MPTATMTTYPIERNDALTCYEAALRCYGREQCTPGGTRNTELITRLDAAMTRLQHAASSRTVEITRDDADTLYLAVMREQGRLCALPLERRPDHYVTALEHAAHVLSWLADKGPVAGPARMNHDEVPGGCGAAIVLMVLFAALGTWMGLIVTGVL